MAATNTSSSVYNPFIRPFELLGEAFERQTYGYRVLLVGAFRLVKDYSQFAIVTMVRSLSTYPDGTVYYFIQFIFRSNKTPNECCVVLDFKTNADGNAAVLGFPSELHQLFKFDTQAGAVFAFVVRAIYTAFGNNVHMKDAEVLLATNATDKEDDFFEMKDENVPIPRRYSSLVPRVWAPPDYKDDRTPMQIVLSCRVCKHCGKGEAKHDKLHRCAGCNFVFYCGEACQRADRKNHRDLCRQEVEKREKIKK